jgi:sugar/nucleoside kinase (ribokinase family)
MVIMVKEDAEDLRARTLRDLKSLPKPKARALLLHDFLMRDMVRYDYSFEEFVGSLVEAYNDGGGVLQGFRQEIEGSGQASSVALSLASLGIDCCLFIRGGEIAKRVADLLIPGVKVTSYPGTLGLTINFSFLPDINVEMCYPGSNENFPPSLILGEDLSGFDIISINNYWLNRSGGELLQYILGKANRTIYLTTGNPEGHERDFLILFKALKGSGGRARASLSEAEALVYMEALGIDHVEDRLSVDEVAELSEALGCYVDVHTPDYTITSGYIVPTFRLKTIYRSIGAGDLWDGGNIYGLLMGLEGDVRATLANGLSGYQISQVGSWLKRPALEDVITFIGRNSLKAI